MPKSDYNVENGKKDHIEEKVSKKAIVPFYKLFRFSKGVDLILIVFMILSSVGVGFSFPMNIFILRDIVNILANPERQPSYYNSLNPMVKRFAFVALSTFICGFVQTICVTLLAERQGKHFKNHYFDALLRQEISWFDGQQTEELMKKINDDIESIEVIIADKLSFFVQQVSSLFGSLIFGFVNGWKLTLIASAIVSLMAFTFLFMMHFVKHYTIAQNQAYSLANGIAKDIISGIRTVVAFNAQDKEVKRYNENLKCAESFGNRRAIFQGIGTGMIGISTFSVASLVFYFGIRWVNTYEYQPGVVVMLFLSIVIGGIGVGNCAVVIETFLKAQMTASSLFAVIDKELGIDTQKSGIIPENTFGDITFNNVSFCHPKQPGDKVLRNLNFTIPSGKTVAFIGPRNSGKSTIMQLLQRLYDPTQGSIDLGEHDLKSVDLNWYRSRISVVKTDPTWFDGTIVENIKLAEETANFDDVVKASKLANAYDFIMDMDQNFNTNLSDPKVKFSEGQKQCISLATALIRKPRLLLVDKAILALDTKYANIIQSCLERAMESKESTVVMVAHKLQIVRNADIIIVMKHGEIIEQGNHEQLVQKEGFYYEMLKIQKMKESKKYNSSSKSMKIDQLFKHTRLRSLSAEIPTDVILIPKTSKFQALEDFIRIMKMQKEKGFHVIIGALASVIVGVSFPAAALIYAQMFYVFKLINDTPTMMIEGNVFCGLMLLPALILFFGQILKAACLGIAGEALTTKIRKKLFKVMLKQEIGWFDKPENATYNLATQLELDTPFIKGMAGLQLGVYLEVFATIATFMAMGLYFSWQLSLLSMLFIPFIVIAGVMQAKLSSDHRITWTDSVASTALILETLNNIRTVQLLGLQKHFSNRYFQILNSTKGSKKLKLSLYALLNALSTSALSFAFCVVFNVGSSIIDVGMIHVIDLTRVFACMSISSGRLGRTLSLSPDVEKARRAARHALATIDRVSHVNEHSKDASLKIEGKIEFKDVYFRYRSTTNVPLFRRFNLKIRAGETVAIVGHSKCGKSTIIQLLERFYDPSIGSVLLDGNDIKYMNLNYLRQHMSLVNQESHLFNTTILENIAFGSNMENCNSEVENAAKMVNIHDLIVSLPESYNTKITDPKNQFTASQIQQICIARTFFNQHSIRILDNATSDLDVETEKFIITSLGHTRKNCTTIIIPYRLSSIENVDKIVVIEEGIVREIGTHEELIDQKGLYYELYLQQLE